MENNKKIITGTLIGLGSLIGLGLVYKYYYGSNSEEKEPKKKETKKVEEKVQQKVQEEEKKPKQKVEEEKEKKIEKEPEEKSTFVIKEPENLVDKKVEVQTKETEKVVKEVEEEEEEDGNGKLTGEYNLENSHFKDNSLSNSIKVDNSFLVVDEPPTPSEFKMFIHPKTVVTPTVELWKCEVAAKFLGIKVNYVEVTNEDVESGFFQEIISPLLKFPTLQTPQGTIWESGAILRYFSTVGNDRQVYNEFVDNWMVWLENLQQKISIVLNYAWIKNKTNKRRL